MDQNNSEMCFCIVCNSKLKSDDGEEENKSKLPFPLDRQVWDVFCQSLRVQNASQFDDILNYFSSGEHDPFCTTCKSEIEKLHIYQEEIKKLKEKVDKVTHNLSSNIIQTTIKTKEAEGNPNKKTKVDGQNGINERIIFMRQQIAKYNSATLDMPIKKKIQKTKVTSGEKSEATITPKIEKQEELLPIIKTEVIQSDQKDMVINPFNSSRPKRRISRKHLYDDIHYGDIPGKEEDDVVVVKKEKIKTTPTKPVKKRKIISTSSEIKIPVTIKVENVSPNSETKERRRLMEWTVVGEKAGKKSFLFDGKWPVSTVVVSNPSGQEMRLQCNTCGAKRRRKPDMTAHIKLRHIDSARYICDVCQKVCHNLSHLKWHKATHKTTFTCPVCAKKYKDKIHLVQHIKVVHGQKKRGGKLVKPIESDVIVNENGEIEEEEDDDDNYNDDDEELEEEEEEFEEQQQQQQKVISATPSASGLVILSCKTVTQSKNKKQVRSKNITTNDADVSPGTMEELEDDNEDEIMNGIQVDGLELSPEDDYNEAYDGVPPPSMPILIPVHFPSSSTSNVTNTTDNTINTSSRHKKWKPLDETGQKSFLYDDQWLVSTVINPSGDLQYYCETCGSKRKRKADMTSHIRLTHIQPLKYVCRFCQKVCYHGGHLKWHEATHSQTPNKCSVESCGRIFKSQNYLALHMKTHVIANKRANINNATKNLPPSPEFPSYGEYLEREENDLDMNSLAEEQKKQKV